MIYPEIPKNWYDPIILSYDMAIYIQANDIPKKHPLCPLLSGSMDQEEPQLVPQRVLKDAKKITMDWFKWGNVQTFSIKHLFNHGFFHSTWGFPVKIFHNKAIHWVWQHGEGDGLSTSGQRTVVKGS